MVAAGGFATRRNRGRDGRERDGRERYGGGDGRGRNFKRHENYRSRD